MRKSYPCATGQHTHHTSKAEAERCVEDAATLRRLGLDEQRGIEAFDSEGEDDGDE
jgi:hypothetical protein